MAQLKRPDGALDLESDATAEAATVEQCAPPFLVPSNVRDQRRRAVGAPLAELNLWEPLAVLASGVPTRADRCIA
jgi:hypothetical protein